MSIEKLCPKCGKLIDYRDSFCMKHRIFTKIHRQGIAKAKIGNKSKLGQKDSLETIEKKKSVWDKKKKELARQRAKKWHSKQKKEQKCLFDFFKR